MSAIACPELRPGASDYAQALVLNVVQHHVSCHCCLEIEFTKEEGR
jgi:predicted fused transcriptional regulator/phosphomethylpyrimidine kinase